MNLPINFFFENTKIGLRDRNHLKAFISKQIRSRGRKLENLNYIFCGDDALKNMNRVHLGHNYFTDIITFDLSESSKIIHAEIYISADRVRDNSRTFDSPVYRELHRVIFHGVLHLLGYQDKSEADIRKMREMENRWIEAYFGK